MGFDILAAIDLHEGRVVRLKRGDFGAVTSHGDDPVAMAEALVDAGARWLHVVDLDGARTGRPMHGTVVEAIAAAVAGRAAVEVGGGIRDDEAADAVLAAGVDRVVLGTAALRKPDLVRRLVERHGAELLAAAIDVRSGRALGHAWQAGAPGSVPTIAMQRLAATGVITFEVTAVERDGTLDGPDVDLLRQLVGLGVGGVIASGGIRSVDDLVAVRDAGCVGAIVGRALYEGRLDLQEAVARLA